MTFAEAQRAIYVAFAATVRKGERPALLAVLRPDRTVTHYVVDPALADGARAHHDCQAAPLDEILKQLAGECEDGRHIVSRSSFDLEVIETSAGHASAARALRAAHVNALDIVPKWALTYGFRADKEQFRTRNQLHTFFPLAGYRPDWRDKSAAPAAWIRHVRAQMAAHRGRYSRVGTPARRDWQQLLAYHRCDCLGMRHLVLRATAETEKRGAYLDATYAVDTGSRLVNFKIGAKKRTLDRLLIRHGATVWSQITACNPGLITRSPADNDSANLTLLSIIRERGYPALPGDGHDDSGRWPAEPTWLAIGMDEAEARLLAREFGQWAIVAGRLGEAARLVWCLDRGPDVLVNGQLQAVP